MPNGDTYNMPGDFRHATVNIKSTVASPCTARPARPTSPTARRPSPPSPPPSTSPPTPYTAPWAK